MALEMRWKLTEIFAPVLSVNELIHWRITVDKSQAHFLYFTFESNEGLVFYSTEQTTLTNPQEGREISIYTHTSLLTQVQHMLSHLKKQVDFDLYASTESTSA
jgi:hypothetical protein